eukprot:m51a1_g6998 putative serine threonine-protein kinase ctr1-like (2210) ;mRNA; r:188190-197572
MISRQHTAAAILLCALAIAVQRSAAIPASCTAATHVLAPSPNSTTGKVVMVVGQSAPLTGPHKRTGLGARAGMLAAFASANEASEVQFELVTLDDASDDTQQQANIRQLLCTGANGTGPVFAIAGTVGSSASEADLSVLKEFVGSDGVPVPFIGGQTSNEVMRTQSVVLQNSRSGVVLVRAGGGDEINAIVSYISSNWTRLSRTSVFYEDTVFGRAAVDILNKTLLSLAGTALFTSYGHRTVTEQTDLIAVAEEAAKVLTAKGNPMAVVLVASGSMSGALIEEMANTDKLGIMYAGMSWITSEELWESASDDAWNTSLVFGSSVYLTQVVPNPANPVEFRKAMRKYQPGKRFTPAAMEGFMAGRLITMAVSRSLELNGWPLTRTSLLDTIFRDIRTFKLYGSFTLGPYGDGVGSTGAQQTSEDWCNQGAHEVYMTSMDLSYLGALVDISWWNFKFSSCSSKWNDTARKALVGFNEEQGMGIVNLFASYYQEARTAASVLVLIDGSTKITVLWNGATHKEIAGDFLEAMKLCKLYNLFGYRNSRNGTEYNDIEVGNITDAKNASIIENAQAGHSFIIVATSDDAWPLMELVWNACPKCPIVLTSVVSSDGILDYLTEKKHRNATWGNLYRTSLTPPASMLASSNPLRQDYESWVSDLDMGQNSFEGFFIGRFISAVFESMEEDTVGEVTAQMLLDAIYSKKYFKVDNRVTVGPFNDGSSGERLCNQGMDSIYVTQFIRDWQYFVYFPFSLNENERCGKEFDPPKPNATDDNTDRTVILSTTIPGFVIVCSLILVAVAIQRSGRATLKKLKRSELEIGERIGKGQFGTVHNGDWHGTPVAIRVIDKTEITHEDLQAIKSEMMLTHSLHHPNLLMMLGYSETKTDLLIVSEYMASGSLHEYLKKNSMNMNYYNKVAIAFDTIKGLAYLHSAKPPVVHGNLSSQSLMIDGSMVTKICDFWCSKKGKNSSSATRRHSAFGIVLWELFIPAELYSTMTDSSKSSSVSPAHSTSTQAVQGGVELQQVTPQQQQQQQQQQGAVPEIHPSTPKEVATLLNRCWQKEPERRPSVFQILRNWPQTFASVGVFEMPTDLSVSSPQTPRNLLSEVSVSIDGRDASDDEMMASATFMLCALALSVQRVATSPASCTAATNVLAPNANSTTGKVVMAVGQSAPLSGPHNQSGIDARAGLLAAFATANGASEVQFELVTLDDASDDARQQANIRQLLCTGANGTGPVFAIAGTVGSSASEADLSVLKEFVGSDGVPVPFIGGQTSSDVLRTQSAVLQNSRSGVALVRASAGDEINAIVTYIASNWTRMNHTSVFYEDTAFGRSIADLLNRTLISIGGAPLFSSYKHSVVSAPADVSAMAQEAAKALCQRGNPQAVVLVVQGSMAGPIIQELSYRNISRLTYAATSYTKGAEIYQSISKSTWMRVINQEDTVFLSQVVPNPVSTKWNPSPYRIVREFQSAMAKYQPGMSISHAALEGFIAGRLITMAVSRSLELNEWPLTRATFLDTIFRDIRTFSLFGDYTLGPYGDGVGSTGAQQTSEDWCNQGAHQVYAETLDLSSGSTWGMASWSFKYSGCSTGWNDTTPRTNVGFMEYTWRSRMDDNAQTGIGLAASMRAHSSDSKFKTIMSKTTDAVFNASVEQMTLRQARPSRSLDLMHSLTTIGGVCPMCPIVLTSPVSMLETKNALNYLVAMNMTFQRLYHTFITPQMDLLSSRDVLRQDFEGWLASDYALQTEFEGFVVGRFISAVIASMEESAVVTQVTAKTLLDAIYATKYFKIDNKLSVGPFLDGSSGERLCNQGMDTIYILQWTGTGFQSVSFSAGTERCGAEFDPPKPNATNSDNTDRTVILSTTIPGFVIVCSLILVAVAIQRSGRATLKKLKRSELEIGERIGKGQFGTVHNGDWHGTPVAIRVIDKTEITHEDLKAIKSEMMMTHSLHHPNLLMMLGYSETKTDLLIVSEYMASGSLHEYLKKNSMNMNYYNKVAIAFDTIKGLAYLHSAKPPVVHGNLSSQSLMIDGSMVTKICDFWCSKKGKNSSSATRRHSGWLAPELIDGKPATTATDVFAFGIVLWELFIPAELYSTMTDSSKSSSVSPAHSTSTQAVQGGVELQQVTPQQQQQQQGAVPEIHPSTPKEVATLLNRCWQKEPERRPSVFQILRNWPQTFASVGVFEMPSDLSVSSPQTPRNLLSEVSVSIDGRDASDDEMMAS